MSAARRLTILFSGMIAGDPHQGGATWAILQYLLGLRSLGHEVYFVEPITAEVLQSADKPLESSERANYFREVVGTFGFTESAALLVRDTRHTVGLDYDALREIAAHTDLLINVSGMLADTDLVGGIPVRAYLDLDPAFVQLWHAHGIDMRFDAHTHFLTVGQNIGRGCCAVPTCGRTWIPTAQPLFLPLWPVAARLEYDALTSIGNWRGYGSIEHEGVHYGQKAHSLRPLFELPTRTNDRLVMALSIHPDERNDLSALARNRWELIDPRKVAGTPGDYQRFIQGSKGEFGIAKSGYVASRCGWFSDRSVCYLASGRPVIAQDTGFSDWLPTGCGLFSFKSIDDVLSAIAVMDVDYAAQCRGARSLAEHFFDSTKVLGRLLQLMGLT